jgi:thiamine-phosphate pyrophosphorylase
MKFPNSGLYAITQTINKSCQQVIAEVEAAIKGGAVVIQYRDKNPIDALFLATELLALCRLHNVPLIINDDIELAAKIGADGVHLGQHDGDIQQAKHCLKKDAIIGVSCYNDVNLAVAAEKQGVSYVAFGRFFPSASKPLAAPAQIETLQQAKKLLQIPIVAIGGILPDNGEILLNAGADLLAVIGGIFAGEVETSARAYQALFKSKQSE